MTNFNFQVTTGILPKYEPSIAVNLLIPGIILATATDHTDGESPKVGLYRSLNGGDTWTTSLLPLPPGIFTGAECASVAYKFPSTFIVSAHVFPGHQFGSTYVYISNDNGTTFSKPILVAPGYGTYINNDETFLIADNGQSSPYLGNVYVVRADQFNVANGGNITAFLDRSRDGGLTWDTPILLSSVTDKVRRPAVTVDVTGIVYASWITVNAPNDRYYVRRSLDGGTTFGPPIIVSDVDPVPLVLPVPGYGFRVLTYPSISCDRSIGPNTGAVYAVWQDNREGYADIFLAKSTNEGMSWSAPVSITGAPAGSQNFFPFIDVDPLTGVVNIVYYSNQVDGFNLDMFVARSINGAQTFTNTRITNVSFNPNAGQIGPTPVPTIGDYITITSVPPGGYIATWMSTAPGSQTIFAGYSDIVIP
ncbi:sialidase family protein [Paenibacillus sp. CF384]|uniref:sialidase family protein n=1 Tax=Paenibacillus sp. CF384 TaxID=1884382 RepID=UPI0008983547|nr:sialidase family protein [Paenibacillus sp. CF384]SDW04346.1 hypothetical protein SAMN05518855_100163 [Paenibacillus sp. CF384]